MTDKQNKSGNKHREREIIGEAPARDEILELLEQHGRPLKRSAILEQLKVIDEGPREIMRRRLKAMIRDGQIVKNRRNAYALPAKMDLVRGRISAHRDGYGFLVPEAGGIDLYLTPREMR
jgi:ribonuclease R